MEHSEQGHAVKAAILSEEFEAKNGEFKYSQKPGLGVEVDENKLNEFIIEPSL